MGCFSYIIKGVFLNARRKIKKIGLIGGIIFVGIFFSLISINYSFLPTINTQDMLTSYYNFYLSNIIAVLSLFIGAIFFGLMIPYNILKIATILIGLIVVIINLLMPTKEMTTFIVNGDNKNKIEIISLLKEDLKNEETITIEVSNKNFYIEELSYEERVSRHNKLKTTNIKKEIEAGKLYELTWTEDNKILIKQKIQIDGLTEEEVADKYCLFCYCDGESVCGIKLSKEMDIPPIHIDGIYTIHIKGTGMYDKVVSNELKYERQGETITIIEN